MAEIHRRILLQKLFSFACRRLQPPQGFLRIVFAISQAIQSPRPGCPGQFRCARRPSVPPHRPHFHLPVRVLLGSQLQSRIQLEEAVNVQVAEFQSHQRSGSTIGSDDLLGMDVS
jgi:hypothetical protein